MKSDTYENRPIRLMSSGQRFANLVTVVRAQDAYEPNSVPNEPRPYRDDDNWTPIPGESSGVIDVDYEVQP